MNTNPCLNNFEPLLEPREAAKLLNVHHVTLLRLVRAGTFPAVRVGKLWRFRATDLNAWVTSQMASQNRRSK
jgi:excisionase family DNA binding protein